MSQKKNEKPLHVAIFQHSDDTPAGTVIDWLNDQGHVYTVYRQHRGETLSTFAGTDWLLILGGPMNVDEVDAYPWLLQEKEWIRQAVNAGVACLGLCLGGQLLAQCLGARVSKNRNWEIGWFPVELDESVASVHSTTVNATLCPFHYHQDMFDLPKGARRIATNVNTPNQGFVFGEHVFGLQFHPESTSAWVALCSEDVEAIRAAAGSGQQDISSVQTLDQVLSGRHHLPSVRTWFDGLLARIAQVALAKRRQNDESQASPLGS